ncbi:MAG TPA: hypothetical protein PLW95_00485 [bacterium]|nr:hypothetical protein [bacterium]
MKREISKGKCFLCGKIYSKKEMTNHLKTCLIKRGFIETPVSQKPCLFHLIIEGHHLYDYWLHILIPFNSTLADLDSFIRNIWVECCGHLSLFRIMDFEFFSDGMDIEPSEEHKELYMDIQVGKILSTGLEFIYLYDFGSTTHLSLKVISSLNYKEKIKKIKLIARNEMPSKTCCICGAKATLVCPYCIDLNKGYFCKKCAEKHECEGGYENFLPVVNSPREGVCGYTGQD